MQHIAGWDAATGARHVVIGVQVGNEVRGQENTKMFSPDDIVSYLSTVAGAVKASPYVVYTRMNCVYMELHANIEANQRLREAGGTNLDFLGLDTYRRHFDTVAQYLATFPTYLPYARDNYRMFMEVGAEQPTVTSAQLGALYGNSAFDYYDMLGPDQQELYDREGETGFKPHGSYIEDVRMTNRMLDTAIADVARNAQGYGLFVHNWMANFRAPTGGVAGIRFTPATIRSQALSIVRSPTEIVLATTRVGTFTYPTTLAVVSASRGYFDTDDRWVDQGAVPVSRSAIKLPAGTTVRLLRESAGVPPARRWQAEFSTIGRGAIVNSARTGFAGNGYVELRYPRAFVEWREVDARSSGLRTLMIRFANGSSTPEKLSVLVNGVRQSLTLPATGSWDTYRTAVVQALVSSGSNVVRLESDGAVIAIDEIGMS